MKKYQIILWKDWVFACWANARQNKTDSTNLCQTYIFDVNPLLVHLF